MIESSNTSSVIRISCSFPSLSTFAVFGCNCINFLIAFEVFLLARDSMALPNKIRVMIITEVSKYTTTCSSSIGIDEGIKVATTL